MKTFFIETISYSTWKLIFKYKNMDLSETHTRFYRLGANATQEASDGHLAGDIHG